MSCSTSILQCSVKLFKAHHSITSLPQHSPKSPSGSLVVHDVGAHSNPNYPALLGTRSVWIRMLIHALESSSVLSLLTVGIFPFAFTDVQITTCFHNPNCVGHTDIQLILYVSPVGFQMPRSTFHCHSAAIKSIAFPFPWVSDVGVRLH